MIVEKLTALFDLDATGFNSGMKNAKKNLDSVKLSVNDTNAKMTNLGSTMSSAAGSIAVATTAIVAFGGAVVGTTIKLAKMAAEVESIERGIKFAAGGARQGREAFKFLTEASDRLGVSLEVGSKSFRLMAAASLNTKLEGEGVKEIFLAIAEASAVMGLSQFQTERIFVAVQQMMSKSRIQAEEFRQQLGEHLPMAARAMADALGVTEAELNKMMEAGVLASEYVLPRFAKQLRKNLAGGVEEASKSIQASLNRLSNAWFMAKREIFKGPTEKGLQIAVQSLTAVVKALPKAWKAVEVSVSSIAKLIGFINIPLTETYEMVGKVAGVFKNLFKSMSKEIPLLGDEQGVVKKVNDYADAIKKAFEDKFSNLRLQLKFERLEAEAETEFDKAKVVIERRMQQRLAMLEDEYQKRLKLVEEHEEEKLALLEKYNDLVADVELTAQTQLSEAMLAANKNSLAKAAQAFEQNYSSIVNFGQSTLKKFTDYLVDMSMGSKKSFKDMIDSMLGDLQRLVYQIFVIEPIIKAFRKLLQDAVPSGAGLLEGGGGSILQGILSAAKGFLGFGSGGVVNEPVMGLGLRSGSGYLIGENGPETITPGSDGLGNVTVNISALDSKSLVDLMENNPQAVLSPLVGALQSGERGVTAALRGTL